jgi:hypothetical protein
MASYGLVEGSIYFGGSGEQKQKQKQKQKRLPPTAHFEKIGCFRPD